MHGTITESPGSASSFMPGMRCTMVNDLLEFNAWKHVASHATSGPERPLALPGQVLLLHTILLSTSI